MSKEIHPIVRNNTYIGHGYWVNTEEFNSLTNQQEFLASPYTMAINKDDYSGPDATPEYFFGIKLASITSGQGFILPANWNLNTEDIETMKTAFKNLVPAREDYGCHDYVIADREVVFN